MISRGFVWSLAAVLGIALTVALAWSVSRLAGQRIGLSSVPPSMIHGLAPASPAPLEREGSSSRASKAARNARHGQRSGTVTPVVAPEAPTTVPAAPVTPASSPSPAVSSPPVASASSSPSAAPAPTRRGAGDQRDDSGGGVAGGGGGGHSGSGRDD